MRWDAPPIAAWIAVVCVSAPLAAGPTLVSRWSFEAEAPGANAVKGAPAARVEGAVPVEGHAGKALMFEDWSVRNYVKPDPRQASRVVVPSSPVLDLTPPFTITAWIYPTAAPVFYGGIVERGSGFGAAYRLVLLRGLQVEAALGEQHVSVRSAGPITLNAWHEVSLAADGKTLVLTVDGKEAGTVPAPATRVSSKADLLIGERFTGRIDEVSIAAE